MACRQPLLRAGVGQIRLVVYEVGEGVFERGGPEGLGQRPKV